jgi:Na+/H+ antiporter NhaD/arsenite permease-like protein
MSELGAKFPIFWALPFAGLILTIAIAPLVAPTFWHRRYGTLAGMWALVLVVPFAAVFGIGRALHGVAHAIIAEYIPFVAVLFALFTIGGGIGLHGRFGGTPLRNAGVLALGTMLASVIGTTGASMLFIRPLIEANEHRAHRVHVIVFFILLVGNVGGALSPLGDPPLFIGFLQGVDFFWTTRALAAPTAFMAIALLAMFVVLDTWLVRRDTPTSTAPAHPFAIAGGINFILLVAVAAIVLVSGLWNPPISFDVLGTTMPLQAVLRDIALVALAGISLWLTPAGVREGNRFHWEPIVEVAKLFAAIFITIAPVIAMLQAGRAGALAPIVAAVTPGAGEPVAARLFWITGALSAFLDNAPTYLVFFNLAGGDAARLMGPLARALAAVSMAAVYFGALTYIGNAPNLMIKAIAEDRGIAMPSFFTYLAYASVALVPLLVAVSLIFL